MLFAEGALVRDESVGLAVQPVYSELRIRPVMLVFCNQDDELRYRQRRLSTNRHSSVVVLVFLLLGLFSSGIDNFMHSSTTAVFLLCRFLPVLVLLSLALLQPGWLSRAWSSLSGVCLSLSTAAVHVIVHLCSAHDSSSYWGLWSCDSVQYGLLPYLSPCLNALLPFVLAFGLCTTWIAAMCAAAFGWVIYFILVVPRLSSNQLGASIANPLIWLCFTAAITFRADRDARVAWKRECSSSRKIASAVNMNVSKAVASGQGTGLMRLLQRTPILLAEVGPDLVLRFVSPFADVLFGVSSDELLRTDFSHQLCRDDVALVCPVLKQLMSTGCKSPSATPLQPAVSFGGSAPLPTEPPLVMRAAFRILRSGGRTLWVDCEGHVIPPYVPSGKQSGVAVLGKPSALLVLRLRAEPPVPALPFAVLTQDLHTPAPNVQLPSQRSSPVVPACASSVLLVANSSAEAAMGVSSEEEKPEHLAKAAGGAPATEASCWVTQSVASPAPPKAAEVPAAQQAACSGAAQLTACSAASPSSTPVTCRAAPAISIPRHCEIAVLQDVSRVDVIDADSKRGPRSPVTAGAELGMNLLLVDDDPVNRRLGARMLQRLGCTCVVLEDGDQVPAALASDAKYDAILLDILMQRTDGTLVCAELRQHGCKLPIIAMTGTSTARDTQQFISFGFDTVLPKPFDIQAMGRAITGACERRNRINAGNAAEIV